MSLEISPDFLLNFSECEMNGKEKHFYQFKSFRLDVEERQLLNNNETVSLTPKVFDVLTALVERGGHLVEKDELLRVVWTDSFVEEANVARIVHTLRKVLGEDENGNKFIETVAKKGYRFVARVDEVREDSRQSVATVGSQDGANLPELLSDKRIVSEPPEVIDKNFVPLLSKPKHAMRIVLFAVGFVSAVSLLFLLSFNFQSKSSVNPNDVKSKHYTTNDEAYRLYLLGTALADKRGTKNAEKAVEYFEQAVRLDPNYATAYAGLANAHTSMATTADDDTHEQYIKAKAAIEKALAIDDNLAEAHSYSGEIKWVCEWDFEGAEREHKRAITLNPNSSAAHRMYALYLASMGRFDEAVAEINTAVDLEPALGLNQRIYGQILYYARRPDEAIARFKQTLEMDSDFASTYFWLIGANRLKGDDDQAFEWFVQMQTKSGTSENEIQSWKTIYAQSGWRGIHERQFEEAKEAEKNGKPNYNQLANLSIELGRRDEAFAYLEKTFLKRQWGMTTLNVNPRYDSIRSDPRFEDLVRRVGLK
jgi:DNA-binding winged helix-turn-helix (wHTH) protein/tetratricopeptide (TPR) repeat protein